MGETHVFKTGFSKFFPLLFAGVVVAAAVFITLDDARELTQSVPLLLAAGLVVWLVFGFPRVEVADGGITLVNVVRTVHIPWPCFTGADSRWNLRIDTTSGSHTSWALPTGSGSARRLRGRKGEESMTSRQLQGNTAEAAVLAIGERAQALKEAGHLDTATLGQVAVSTRVNREAVAGAAAVALLVLLGAW